MDGSDWKFKAPPDPNPRLLPIQCQLILLPIGSLGFLVVVSRLVGRSLDSCLADRPLQERTFSLSGVLTIIYFCIIGLRPGKSSIWGGRAKDGFPPQAILYGSN
jgi:hypothetical protein